MDFTKRKNYLKFEMSKLLTMTTLCPRLTTLTLTGKSFNQFLFMYSSLKCTNVTQDD